MTQPAVQLPKKPPERALMDMIVKVARTTDKTKLWLRSLKECSRANDA